MVHLNDVLTNQISPVVEGTSGVAQVTIGGGYARSIIVNVDPDKLQSFGITMADVSTRLKQENISLPAGSAKEGNTQFNIRSVGYFNSPSEISQMPLATVDGEIVSLGQVASVIDSTQDIQYYTRVNGEPGIGMSIQKQADANTVETANAVKDQITKISARYPNLHFRTAYDQSQFVQNRDLVRREVYYRKQRSIAERPKLVHPNAATR